MRPDLALARRTSNERHRSRSSSSRNTLRFVTSPLSQLTLVALAAVLAPILAEFSGPLAIPGVVLEIMLGVLIGPQVLGWTTPDGLLAIFGGFGLAFLM